MKLWVVLAFSLGLLAGERAMADSKTHCEKDPWSDGYTCTTTDY